MNQSFSDSGYFHAKSLISRELAGFCVTQLELIQATYAFQTGLSVAKNVVNDARFPNAFSWYASQCTESLLVFLQPKIEAIVGCTLYPAYSYSRIYFRDSILKKHKDRLGSEYAVSICIEKDPVGWELGLNGLDSSKVKLDLEVGDACVYFGSKVEHWRPKFEGCRQMQIFLFYVAQDGDFSEFKFDKRPFLAMSNVTRSK